MAVIKHRDNSDPRGLWKDQDPSHYLYPRNSHLNVKESDVVVWRYHVVLVYHDQIIDLDIKDSNAMLQGRDYIKSMFKPITSVKDFKASILNRWEDIEVFKVPVAHYLNDKRFNAVNGVDRAFSYPKQNLMDFYISLYKENQNNEIIAIPTH